MGTDVNCTLIMHVHKLRRTVKASIRVNTYHSIYNPMTTLKARYHQHDFGHNLTTRATCRINGSSYNN